MSEDARIPTRAAPSAAFGSPQRWSRRSSLPPRSRLRPRRRRFAQARPTNLADLVEQVADAVVNISATQTIEDKGRAIATPDLPKGTPFDEMFEEFFKNHGITPSAAAPGAVARLGLRHRPERHRHHQQSRGRRRQRHRRHLHRRPQAEGQGRRQGFQSRRRRAQGGERQAAEDRQVRRQRQDARRRRRDGGRQPVRPRRNGDRRHHLRPQPQYRQRPLRRFPADRRLDQQGQFGRPAVQPAGRGDRHQHGDSFAVGRLDRHRLCDAVRHGHAGDRPARAVPRDAARLARRPNPAGRRHHRRQSRLGDGPRRADRRRRRQGSGQARRAQGRRRDRQVRRQGHQGIARPAAPRRLHAGRQVGRGRRRSRRQGSDQDGDARPPRGRRKAKRGREQRGRDAAAERGREGARHGVLRPHRRGAQDLQDQGQHQGRRRDLGRSGIARRRTRPAGRAT